MYSVFALDTFIGVVGVDYCMRLAPLVAPPHVLAVCEIYMICAFIRVGQCLHECVRCALNFFNRNIRLGSACLKPICV